MRPLKACSRGWFGLVAAAAIALLGCEDRPEPAAPSNGGHASAPAATTPATPPAGASPSAPSAPTHEIRIAAASSMKGALTDLAAAFRTEHAGVKITPTFGASGNFYTQLVNKAPFDLFLSADTTYPHKLAESGLAAPGSERMYACGVLVLWVLKNSTLDIEHEGLKALTAPQIKHIAMANPQHAPYGRAAEAALKASGIEESIKGKIVLGENVEQTAQFAQTGAAEAALIPLSLAIAAKDAGRYVPVPKELYAPIEHGLVITAWAQDPDQARAFSEFILSPTGREILTRYGLAPVEQ